MPSQPARTRCSASPSVIESQHPDPKTPRNESGPVGLTRQAQKSFIERRWITQLRRSCSPTHRCTHRHTAPELSPEREHEREMLLGNIRLCTMTPEDSALREISQTQKDKHGVISPPRAVLEKSSSYQQKVGQWSPGAGGGGAPAQRGRTCARARVSCVANAR